MISLLKWLCLIWAYGRVWPSDIEKQQSEYSVIGKALYYSPETARPFLPDFATVSLCHFYLTLSFVNLAFEAQLIKTFQLEKGGLMMRLR